MISDERILESSGLALSRREPDAVWIHNDSGDTARLFLVGMEGNTRGVFHLADVPMPLDWEDMCSFTLEGEPWLLVGDVGDNASHRRLGAPESGPERACRLLLLHEPALKVGSEQDAVPVHATILFEYEDGPRNCESVAVDTERREILLVSKSKSTPLDCGVYTIPLTLEAGTTSAVARRIGELDTPYATAMDIAPDNHRLVLISARGALVVDRDPDQEWGEALKGASTLLTLPRRENGETVCFGRNRDELLLNSERIGQPLWRVTIPAPPGARAGDE
ncbi:MAG: hypothetical protein KF886_00415 [Candidatus Hydrogenedentes bacterium]|nr:hypothetical protein [Candidatus Hydrogenedentota bacterium]